MAMNGNARRLNGENHSHQLQNKVQNKAFQTRGGSDSQSPNHHKSGTYPIPRPENRHPTRENRLPTRDVPVSEPSAAPLLSSEHAMSRIGCNYDHLRYLQKTFKLRPVHKEAGRLFYREADVDQFLAQRTSTNGNFGKLTARAFELLTASNTARELCIELEIPAAVAKSLCEEFASAPALFLPANIVEQLKALGFAGSGPLGAMCAEDFPRRMEILLNEARRSSARVRTLERELRRLRAKTGSNGASAAEQTDSAPPLNATNAGAEGGHANDGENQS